jgi:hypothetical protein
MKDLRNFLISRAPFFLLSRRIEASSNQMDANGWMAASGAHNGIAAMSCKAQYGSQDWRMIGLEEAVAYLVKFDTVP